MRRVFVLAAIAMGCGGPATLDVTMPLHLEEHLDAAIITGSERPPNAPPSVEWRFDQPRTDWTATPAWNPPFGIATLEPSSEGLRIMLGTATKIPDGRLRGGIHIDVPDWQRGDWAEVVVRARADSASSINRLGIGFNQRQGRGTRDSVRAPFLYGGQESPVVRDGTVQTYRLRVSVGARFEGAWRQLFLWFGSQEEPGSIDLLSVNVEPAGREYADTSHGVRSVRAGNRTRRTLFTHAPGKVAYRVRVPANGRLDLGLGIQTKKSPVTFAVTAANNGEGADTLFSERYGDDSGWGQRSVDLTRYAGRTITLALEASADQSGAVALWGAPTISGRRTSTKPNVIFYVIDGGAADQMSVYGYNRRTTPNLERLAAEGALFEHAYSNGSWTKVSTTSFMTSLHNSVLGNVGGQVGFESLPLEAKTMAERFHAAGYPTAVFTSNNYAGSVSGLERSVDLLRDVGVRRDYTSSVELHRDYWTWRDAYPVQPYWVHVQTTDVHEYEDGQPAPVAPFSGMYVTAGRRREFSQEWERLIKKRNSASDGGSFWRDAFAAAGVDRAGFFETMLALYDESLAHQDYRLGQLVARLRERGEWGNTLLIVAADHAIAAALRDIGALMQDSVPPAWNEPMLRSSISRVPLIFVWPGRIAAGQRFDSPVSMIDVLPTVLDLAGLPAPEILQGQSLAPLLLGRAGWQPRPVILDEFEKDPRTGELRGRIEMIDGRWGASLWVGPPRDSLNHRPVPLLLFDVWNDPLALHLLNDGHPELVNRYTLLLRKQWEAHRLLAKRFTAGGKVELTPEQLETLRALGYIR